MHAVSPAKRCPCCVVACLVCASASRCRCHALPRTLTWHGHSFLLTIARLACYNLTTPCIITLHTMPHRHFALGVTTGHLTSELVVSQDMIHANLLTYPSGCTIGFPLGTECPSCHEKIPSTVGHAPLHDTLYKGSSQRPAIDKGAGARPLCLSVRLAFCLSSRCLAFCLQVSCSLSCLSAYSVSLSLRALSLPGAGASPPSVT